MSTHGQGTGEAHGAVEAAPAGGRARLLFIDNIRVFLTILVILHHLMITYAGTGSWIYREGRQDAVTDALGGWFCAVDQAYFMGLFLLISAYFVPGSFDRKGPGRFLKDRLIRLGIPLALFSWIVIPLFAWWFYGFAGSCRSGTFLTTTTSAAADPRPGPALVRRGAADLLARLRALADARAAGPAARRDAGAVPSRPHHRPLRRSAWAPRPGCCASPFPMDGYASGRSTCSWASSPSYVALFVIGLRGLPPRLAAGPAGQDGPPLAGSPPPSSSWPGRR